MIVTVDPSYIMLGIPDIYIIVLVHMYNAYNSHQVLTWGSLITSLELRGVFNH